MRIVVRGDRIVSVQREGEGGPAIPPDAGRIDLGGRVVMPGLIDLHFHVERDPRLAVRQLANGVTSFRDPGQWIDQFDSLKAIMRSEHLPGPRMALAGPHIDGERPAYPLDAIVARDPEEARRAAERNIADGATALKIYFRLPLASAMAVVRCAGRTMCPAPRISRSSTPATCSSRAWMASSTSRRWAPASSRSGAPNGIDRRCWPTTTRGGMGGTRCSPTPTWQAPRRDACTRCSSARIRSSIRRWRCSKCGPAAPREGSKQDPAVDLKGYAQMKALTLAAFQHGARLTLGGHSTVPFAGRGEAPWREMEMLVESGLTPLQAITAATQTSAASLRRPTDLGTIEAGKLADLIVLGQDPSRDIHAIRTVQRVMSGGAWVDVARYRTW